MTNLTEHPNEWYVHSFGELYPLIYHHRDDDQARAEVADLVELVGLRAGQAVLDVCCGAGRHLAALVEAGMDAFGVDLSEPLLNRAVERPNLTGRLLRADVRNLPFRPCFDAAINLFTSFGYFATDEENARQLNQMVRVLRPGGTLLMDLPHRAALERNFVPHDRQEIGGLRVEHRRRIVGERVVKHTTVTDLDEEHDTRFFTESVRVYDPDELTAMAAAAGLQQIRLFGSFDSRPFEEHSPRMIVVGVRS